MVVLTTTGRGRGCLRLFAPRKQENKNSTKKKRKNFIFLDHFLGRVLVFLFIYFLVFFYKFPPLLSWDENGVGCKGTYIENMCPEIRWTYRCIAYYRIPMTLSKIVTLVGVSVRESTSAPIKCNFPPF